MRLALVNPNWSFEGSVYFGCREPHLPLEFGYARALLRADGHDVLLVDGQLEELSGEELAARVGAFAPDATVVTTAPSYLFWRCAPPELRAPMLAVRDLRGVGGMLIAVGPHGSSSPGAVLRKLGVNLVVMGECEEVLRDLARVLPEGMRRSPVALDVSAVQSVQSVCFWRDGEPWVRGDPAAADVTALPALRWESELLARHGHHHHRFEAPAMGPGAELETSRGCPFRCSFCAKELFRNRFRRRPLDVVLAELDGLIAAGVTYVYFVDEIFLPWVELLEALVARPVRFGVQTRIDLWKHEALALLGRAGCVSIEAGVESISSVGRESLEKRCRLSTDQLTELLVYARRYVPFVQANLLDAGTDDPAEVETWRARLLADGVWANKPVPLFPYPGSPDYTRRWGAPDDQAWERAHGEYLRVVGGQDGAPLSDIQDARPLPLPVLERV